jgi:hypothetical protein
MPQSSYKAPAPQLDLDFDLDAMLGASKFGTRRAKQQKRAVKSKKSQQFNDIDCDLLSPMINGKCFVGA